MRSSTAIAERLGELGFLNLLNRFIVDLSLAIAEAGGEIHKYVGDEIIATWRLPPGMSRDAFAPVSYAGLRLIEIEMRLPACAAACVSA